MSDVERVAAAMRKADAELEVHPPDVTETADHARRSLIRRLLIVGALSALGATLLIVGGTAPAITHIRAERTASHDQKSGNGKEKGNGKPGKNGEREEEQEEREEKKEGGGDHPKHHEKLVAAVGPGEPIEVSLPDLVVSHVTKTEVTVANHSSVPAEPFEVGVTLEVKGENPITATVSFEEGLEAEAEETKTFKLTCEKGGVISAEVDPTNEIEESSEEDNASTESPPVECEAAEVKEEETEKGKTKEPSGSGSGRAPVDSSTSPTGGATAP